MSSKTLSKKKKRKIDRIKKFKFIIPIKENKDLTLLSNDFKRKFIRNFSTKKDYPLFLQIYDYRTKSFINILNS